MPVERLHPSTIADLEALVGRDLGPTDWHTLTQEQINAFADLTGDQQWIHVDEQRSAEGPFGRTIGHGLLTLSLGPQFMEELFAFDGFRHSLNYGYDKVRFPHPRPVGTNVRMTASVTLVTRAKDTDSALISIRQVFEADGITKPVCVAESKAYFTEREQDGASEPS